MFTCETYQTPTPTTTPTTFLNGAATAMLITKVPDAGAAVNAAGGTSVADTAADRD